LLLSAARLWILIISNIKTLFLAANPTGTPRLQLDEEIRSIAEKIRASEYRDMIKVEQAWAVRPDDLIPLLNQHQPQIIHFSGHGSPVGQIILLDQTGMAKAVSVEAIDSLFEILKDNIRLVVLNACYSRLQAEAIVKHIDCVIGMNTSIADQATIKFAAALYGALGFGRSVQ